MTRRIAEEIEIGIRVRSKVNFSGVKKGTEGIVVDDYGSGYTVAWDLPHQPYPHNFAPEEVATMPAVSKICPLRDGFDKKLELHFLEIVGDDGEIMSPEHASSHYGKRVIFDLYDETTGYYHPKKGKITGMLIFGMEENRVKNVNLETLKRRHHEST